MFLSIHSLCALKIIIIIIMIIKSNTAGQMTILLKLPNSRPGKKYTLINVISLSFILLE